MCVFRSHTNMQGNGHADCRPQGETTTNPLKEKEKRNIFTPGAELFCP